ncbi:MAG: phospholipid/cholesterol/gamma-HCH transport system permease protein [Myxococcota bacterium]|jgi:phospholipid/cholesterol/gamma-HCH transport system permease protein
MTAALLDATLGRVGRSYLSFATLVGGSFLVLGRILRAMVPPRFDRDETWRALYNIGVKSYPVVIMTAVFVGAIMVLQSAYFVQRTGATGLLGFGVGFSVLAEIGPILIGLMFSGRVGANNTAELGTMVVTEQIDALRTLAIDPIRYLVVPRFVAMLVMMTLLMVLGDLFAILGAAFSADVIIGIDWRVLIGAILDNHFLDEFFMGVVKASCFGVSISCISCHYGLTVTGGAAGVGRAVNASVVANAAAIFVINFAVGMLYAL